MHFSIEPISALMPQQDLSAVSGIGSGTGVSAPNAGGFADLVQGGLADLNASVGAAESAMRDLAAGKTGELHELMISLERARISVQTFVQVRNKLIDSYQELMRMQL
jgi:flagellar hook-basal body complex protein FliE